MHCLGKFVIVCLILWCAVLMVLTPIGCQYLQNEGPDWARYPDSVVERDPDADYVVQYVGKSQPPSGIDAAATAMFLLLGGAAAWGVVVLIRDKK